MRRFVPASVALVALTTLAACARVHSATDAAIMQQGAPAVRHGRVTDHVIVISVDGLRPDAIRKFNAQTMQRLMREGRYSLTAQTIKTSLTLPSHTSMLTGVDETVHHVTWNSDRTKEKGYVTVPTVFGVAHSSGFTTAAFFSKTKFHHLEIPSTLDFSRSPHGSGMNSMFSAERTEEYFAQYVSQTKPNLTFVHFMEADFIGHQFGWMGHTYGMAVREVDKNIARLLDDADARFGTGNYTVIVTADHGGHGKAHGTTDPRDMTIPWVVWGAGVQRGDTLSGIRTMDTAATVLWLLGVDAPQNWVGRPVSAAFESSFVSGR